MERAVLRPAVAADAAAVTEVVAALESSLYGRTSFSQTDLEREWSELDLAHDVRVVRDGDRIVGYGAVRVFRELRIDLEVPPPAPEWPDGLRVVPFDPERDAPEFHAAHQEAFADHWDYTPRDLEPWSKSHLKSERFDPTLWCVVRAGDQIAAGTICTGDTYGGGFIHALFTRRPWRKQGVGAALLSDSFGRFWERGEHSVGLGVDAASDTGAFRLYQRAGMAPVVGWVMYEKQIGDPA